MYVGCVCIAVWGPLARAKAWKLEKVQFPLLFVILLNFLKLGFFFIPSFFSFYYYYPFLKKVLYFQISHGSADHSGG